MKRYFLALSILTVLLFGFGNSVLAQDTYKPLTAIPGTTNGKGTVDLNKYIPAMFKLAIGIAGGLAVLRIIIGGIKYMTTDAFGEKSEAKDTIQNSLVGLLLAISAYTILYTVNPKLVNFDLSIEGLRLGPPISSTTTPTIINPNSPSLVGCVDCDLFPSNVPKKSAQNGGCALPGPCVVNKAVGQKLSQLTTLLENAGVRFQVTESYPPTIQHEATCQQVGQPDSGTCVDAALRDYPIATNINKFTQLARSVGLRAVYEVSDPDRRTELLRGGVVAGSIIVVQGINGEHFSVYNN